MERKSGTDAWDRAGMEILCLEQLHETVVRNRCMEQSLNGNTLEQLHVTEVWNRVGTEILCLEQIHGTELAQKNTSTDAKNAQN